LSNNLDKINVWFEKSLTTENAGNEEPFALSGVRTVAMLNIPAFLDVTPCVLELTCSHTFTLRRISEGGNLQEVR
jgi:hypothetical protein